MPSYEIALSVQSKAPLAGRPRIQEGDIVAIRPARGQIGRKERAEFLWLVVDIPDALARQLLDRDALPDGSPNIDAPKRNRSIALDDLANHAPGLDLQRVRDTSDNYQPFVTLNETTGAISGTVPLGNIVSLIRSRSNNGNGNGNGNGNASIQPPTDGIKPPQRN